MSFGAAAVIFLLKIPPLLPRMESFNQVHVLLCPLLREGAVVLLMMVSFKRPMRALTSSSAAPFTTLQGAPFEPLTLPSRRTGSTNNPLHLAKWQPLTMRAILFDTGQTPKTFCSPAASCWTNTPVQLQREANKVRKCEREVWVSNGTSWTETNKRTRSLAFSHNAQKATTAVCQRRDRHQ